MTGGGMGSALRSFAHLKEGASVGFEAFIWTAQAQPVGDAAGDVPVQAVLAPTLGGGRLVFWSMGVMKGWSPSSTDSPLRVVFDDFVVPAGVTDGFVRSGVTVTAVPGVVPLPGGILLLVTALLGVFGLSRRRNFAAA